MFRLRTFRKELDVSFSDGKICLRHPKVGSYAQNQMYQNSLMDFKEASRCFYKITKKVGKL